jgi:uncharacterized protein (TIGR03118 family)
MIRKNFLSGLVVLFFLWGCQKNIDKSPKAVNEATQELQPSSELKDFIQVNLVGDNDELSPAHIDPTLINAWGIAFPSSGGAWVSSQGGSLGEIYNSDGTVARPPVAIPSHTAATGGHPTGVVANNTTDFKLPNGNPAKFIFAEAEGVISAWNGGNAAIKVAEDINNPFYFGIALASDGGNNFLYIANFSEGKIEVYDKDFKEVSKPFTDPDLPAGFSPVNIQNIDGKLYVMYAKPGRGGDEVIFPRDGFVDIYNPDGTFLRRFISQGQLNAPWGIEKAPAGFWGEDTDTRDIFLVGNFGDGHINAYNSEGVFQGQLREHGNPIVIERLWAIAFPPASSTAFNHNSLFFAAGPGKEQHGLFGFIKK